jgi:hypothetical protein
MIRNQQRASPSQLLVILALKVDLPLPVEPKVLPATWTRVTRQMGVNRHHESLTRACELLLFKGDHVHP